MNGDAVPVLEIGGTHVTAAWVDPDRWVVVAGTAVRHRLQADGSADELVATVAGAASAIGAVGRPRWGVAIPGPFDYVRGIGDFAGVGKFEAWRGVDVGERLAAALASPGARFAFLNDADAFGIGEWVAGASRGHARTMAITLGTGVGSAFTVDGSPRHDGLGVAPDGRLDLVEVGGRPLEDTVSRRAIRSTYAALRGPEDERPDVRQIAGLARGGDSVASRALTEPLTTLGQVVAPLAMDFAATVVVVGGSIALAWDVVEGPLRAGMDLVDPQWSRRYRLVRARWTEEAAFLGAAKHALA